MEWHCKDAQLYKLFSITTKTLWGSWIWSFLFYIIDNIHIWYLHVYGCWFCWNTSDIIGVWRLLWIALNQATRVTIWEINSHRDYSWSCRLGLSILKLLRYYMYTLKVIRKLKRVTESDDDDKKWNLGSMDNCMKMVHILHVLVSSLKVMTYDLKMVEFALIVHILF